MSVDLLICLGIPSLVIGPICAAVTPTNGEGLTIFSICTDYVIQMNRFAIIETYGCIPVVLNAGLALILIHGWTIILPFVSVAFYYRMSPAYHLISTSVLIHVPSKNNVGLLSPL